MKKIILFLFIVSTVYSSCSRLQEDIFIQNGINLSSENNSTFIVINPYDCVACFSASENYLRNSIDQNSSNIYIVLPMLRDANYQQFLLENKLDNIKTLVIRSKDLINYISNEANVKQFSSFKTEYDYKTKKFGNVKFLKKM